MRFDHIIIGVKTLKDAMQDYEATGFTVHSGGQHAAGTTHNAIISLRDGSYLELIAPTGEKPEAGTTTTDFAAMLKNTEGIIGYAFQVDDLDAAVQGLRDRGVSAPEVTAGQRTRDDGVVLKWRLARLVIGGVTVILISDETERHLRIPGAEERVTHANLALGVRSLLHVAADPAAVQAQLAATFGVTPDAETGILRVADVEISVIAPTTDLLQEIHQQRGDSVWRAILTGPGEMYKRLPTESLHGAQLIIVGSRETED
jgi:hypothetical protein